MHSADIDTHSQECIRASKDLSANLDKLDEFAKSSRFASSNSGAASSQKLELLQQLLKGSNILSASSVDFLESAKSQSSKYDLRDFDNLNSNVQ